MRKFAVISCYLLIFLFVASTIKAHPGRTSADGCHYCRTNCAKWGEIEGARHCHGGNPPAPIYTTSPKTPVPMLITVTPKPTPTHSSTPAQTISPTPTQKSGVLGSADEEGKNPLFTLLWLTAGGLFTWKVIKFLKNRHPNNKNDE